MAAPTLTSSRPLYSHAQLQRLLEPRSIAIVGVSANASGFGSTTLANITAPGRFEGHVYRVNARLQTLDGQPCYPSVAALPQSPDCVFIAAPRASVPAILQDCVTRGAGGVVMYASGYAETGHPAHTLEQQALIATTRAAGIPLLGPNCMGYIHYGIGAVGTFAASSFRGKPQEPAIGLISQSGAIGAALAQAIDRGVVLSHMLTCGNAGDVDVADLVNYLAADPRCSAVACVFEGMADPRRFLAAAAACLAMGKPLVVHKLGTSERGALAAASHTGSVAGSQAAYRAAFAQAGVVLVDELEALIDTCSFFAKAPRPLARGVAGAAVSGGACILLADRAEAAGIALPAPAANTLAALRPLIPDYGSPGNPCDMTAQVLATPGHQIACFEALLSDAQYGALVVPHTTASGAVGGRLEALNEVTARHGKIACNIWLTQHPEERGAIDAERHSHIASFRSMRHCVEALAAWHRRTDWLDGQRPAAPALAPATARAQAAALIAASPNETLTEREGKAVLAAYGIPVARDMLAQDAAQAADVAQALGFPVVLKIESPDIPHKTEAGGVRLNLRSLDEVREAFDEIVANARAWAPAARIDGVLIQPMVAAGTEIMVGGRIDPQFGPIVVAGLGGVLVELLRDTAVRLAPVSPAQAREMLSELKGQSVLRGFRGAAPVDLDRLCDTIARISELLHDQRELIAELDVNPLICAGERVMAVDALLVRAPRNLPASQDAVLLEPVA